MREVVKAVVRSTLPEARAEAVTEAPALPEGEVRKPVTGEARTDEANTEPVVLTTSVNEADGVSRGDVAEGGEPNGCQGVGIRHGVEDRRTEQVALSAEVARRERRRREARSVGAGTIGVVTGSGGAGRRPER